jgi:hypothetical protein
MPQRRLSDMWGDDTLSADFLRWTQRIRVLPGLTAPVFLVAWKRSIWHDIFSLAVDILDLRAWRDMDPLACVLMAAFTAIIAQPLFFGSLGNCIRALMTPVR